MRDITIQATQSGLPGPSPAVFHALDYCRERSISVLACALREALQGLGSGAGDGVSGVAFAFARRKERDLEAAFRRNLFSRFGAAVTGSCERPDWAFNDRLRGEPALLQDLVTRELALEMNLAAHDAYLCFDREIRALLQDPSWDAARNPLAPRLVAAAIADAAEASGAPRVVAFTLTAYLMHGMAGALNVLYGDIAAYLKNHARPIQADADTDTGDALAIEVWDPTEDGPEMMVLLRHLVPGDTARLAPPASFDARGWLAELQRVEVHALEAELHGGALDLTPPDRTLLRALKETPAALNLQHHELVVLDVVGRMFEYMLNGSGVPMGMKRILSRLQIPVFKAALLDPDFFGREAHPARQLINEIAAASVGWDEGGMLYAHLLRKVTAQAHALLSRFDSDLVAFERALAEFREFLAQQQRQPDRTAEALMVLLQREETRQAEQDAARRAAEAAITGRVADQEVPESVRLFLCREWIGPLQAAYLEGGDQGNAWQESVSLMDDLIWSVRPKLSHESRHYLVKTLPGLLRRLGQGMTRAGIAQEAREEFMSRLVICHAQAVKRGYQADELQPAPDEAWKVAALARAAQAGMSAVVLPFEAPPASADGSPVSLRFVDPRAVSATLVEETLAVGEFDSGVDVPGAAHLKPGVWLAFRYGHGDSYLARLKWVSPVKRTYVFVDREGRRVATMAEAQLDVALRGGAARVVEQTPLVDRAMRHVMEALKHAAAA